MADDSLRASGTRPPTPFNRPIAAHFSGGLSFPVSVTILTSRLARRSRRRRAGVSERFRRNISRTCWVERSESSYQPDRRKEKKTALLPEALVQGVSAGSGPGGTRPSETSGAIPDHLLRFFTSCRSIEPDRFPNSCPARSGDVSPQLGRRFRTPHARAPRQPHRQNPHRNPKT